MATLGSVTGCFLLYYVAGKGGEAFLRKRTSAGRLDRALALYRRHGLLALMVPALLPPPAPFKLFVLGAGLAGVRPLPFVTPSPSPAAPRYLALGLLAIYFGDAALELMRTRGREVALWVVGLILAGHRLVVVQPCAEGPCRRHGPDVSVVIPAEGRGRQRRPAARRAGPRLRGQWPALRSDPRRRRQRRTAPSRGSRRIRQRDGRLRVIRFARNFGQSAAFTAGFAAARGQSVVTFDGDLQNDPADIPRLLPMADEADIVCGWRKQPPGRLADPARAVGGRQLADRPRDAACGCTTTAAR